MNGFQKLKCAKALVDNTLKFNKLPDVVKEEVDDLKDDLKLLQKYTKTLVDEQDALMAKAKLVVDKKLKANLPLESYLIAYGPIKYSKK